MKSQYMVDIVDQFFARLDKADNILKTFSNDVQGRENQVFTLLEQLIENTKIDSTSYNKLHSNDKIQVKLQESLQNFNKVVSSWGSCIAESKKGQKFIHENEKNMLVMIFGQVNTGKSSVGNFLAGKPFLAAPFVTAYKKRYGSYERRPQFKTEVKGREGNMDGDWFREGVLDTTGAIQHFTMPGLRWVDSPGTGAVAKVDDTCDMERLVREYLNYADLGVFLMSSDSPGLQPDFKYIKRLQDNGKPAIVLITKSDRNDEKILDGEIVANWVGKKDDDRRAQESWIGSELAKMGVQDKFQVISVSAYLAIQGIEEQNDDMFRQSQMDKFMTVLGEKISDEALLLKERNPKENINRLIKEITQGVVSDEKQIGFKGAQFLEKQFDEVIAAIEEHKKKLKELEHSVVQRIASIVKPELQIEIGKRASQVEKENRQVSGEELSQLAVDILQKVTQTELDRGITELISSFDKKQLKLNINVKMESGLEKKQETIEQKIVHYSRVERDPKGFFENVRGFFGKEYYRNEREEEIKYVKIDVGTNLQLVLDDVMKLADKQIQSVVKNELHRLSIEYFAPQEKYVQNIRNQLQQFQTKLINLKFNL